MARTTSPQTYFPWVRQAATQYGVPADLLAAQIDAESSWDPTVVSPAGAIGISQFMPSTAAGFGIDPHDPHQSIEGQARYMHNLLERYKGNVAEALAAYNAGSGAVDRYGGIPPYAETQRYVQTVQQRRSRYPGLAHGGTAASGAPTAVSSPPGTAGVPATGAPAAPAASTDVGNPALAGLAASINAFAQQSAQSFGLPAPPVLSEQQIDVLPATASPIQGGGTTTPRPVVSDAGPPNTNAQGVINIAKRYLGTPYHWGGANPQTGFDCSGLLQYTMGQVGIKIPRTSEEQWKVGVHVNLTNLKPGDAVFFRGTDGPANDIGHVGIYLGGGQFLHAPHTGDVVKISNLNESYYRAHFAGGRRFTR